MPSPDTLVEFYNRRLVALEQEQSSYLPAWKDIRDYLAPYSGRFSGEQARDGKRMDSNIINTNPLYAVRTLPAGMQSGITSPLRPWFRLTVPDPELNEFPPVKDWLFESERRMRVVMARSNLYDRLKSNYYILGNYGTSALIIDEDSQDVVRGTDLLMGSFMIATDARGRVDTLYRTVEMTVWQIVGAFPDRAPKDIQGMYDRGNYEQSYPVCHVIEPNRYYRPGSKLSQFKKYAGVYFLKGKSGKDAILQYRGYNDIPMMCPRWDVVGENSYGIGCGHIALGDSRQVQHMEKRKLQGMDKNVNPAMIADASMRNQATSILPGSKTYVNGLITGNPGFRPAYQVNPYTNELREEIVRIESHIDEAYYKNLFLLVTEFAGEPNITATAINTMREEKLLMLGPVLERLNDELLDPLIDRVFNIMYRKGFFPEPPEELSEMPLRVEYISVLAQAQKAMGIGNIERFVGFVGNLASGYPEAADKLDVDEVIDAYADGVAVPPNIVRSNDEAVQLREGRAAQQEMDQQLAAGESMANTVKNLAQADMDGSNVLTAALEVAGGAA